MVDWLVWCILYDCVACLMDKSLCMSQVKKDFIIECNMRLRLENVGNDLFGSVRAG